IETIHPDVELRVELDRLNTQVVNGNFAVNTEEVAKLMDKVLLSNIDFEQRLKLAEELLIQESREAFNAVRNKINREVKKKRGDEHKITFDAAKGVVDKQFEHFRLKILAIGAVYGFMKGEKENTYIIRTILNEPIFLKKTKIFSTGLLFKIDEGYKFVFKLDSRLLDAGMKLLTREWHSTDNGELRIYVKNDQTDHCIIRKDTPIVHLEVVKIADNSSSDTNTNIIDNSINTNILTSNIPNNNINTTSNNNINTNNKPTSSNNNINII